jgi:hypothetical protein
MAASKIASKVEAEKPAKKGVLPLLVVNRRVDINPPFFSFKQNLQLVVVGGRNLQRSTNSWCA